MSCYTQEKNAWEDLKVQVVAIEMALDLRETLGETKTLKYLLDNWKIGMIQGLLENDEEDYCSACETGCDFGHTNDYRCSCYVQEYYGNLEYFGATY